MGKLPYEKIKREIFIRKEATTDENYGCVPEKRDTKEIINYGIVNVNKPSGPTSHQIADYVKKILGIKKAGHSGTLDPKVTGVLPIALGKATRITEILLKTGKEYVCLAHFHTSVEKDKIIESSKKLVGEIEQLPPRRCAVKRVKRKRTIYYLEILEIEGKDVLFRIGCQAGTYIRKFVHDWAGIFGTRAHMVQLIRTRVGQFTDKDWVTLHELKDAYELWKTEGNEKEIRRVILPVEKAVEHLPKVWVFDNAVDSLCHGASLSVPGVSKLNNIYEGEVVAIMSLKNELICLAKCLMNTEKILSSNKGLAFKVFKVFMKRGTYPKWKKEST